MFFFYASFVHNQYFSKVAVIDRKVVLGGECDEVYSALEGYRSSIPAGVFVGRSAISSNPEWAHRADVASIISVSDMSTPFDTINYYVFCNSDGVVLKTLLVGD